MRTSEAIPFTAAGTPPAVTTTPDGRPLPFAHLPLDAEALRLPLSWGRDPLPIHIPKLAVAGGGGSGASLAEPTHLSPYGSGMPAPMAGVQLVMPTLPERPDHGTLRGLVTAGSQEPSCLLSDRSCQQLQAGPLPLAPEQTATCRCSAASKAGQSQLQAGAFGPDALPGYAPAGLQLGACPHVGSWSDWAGQLCWSSPGELSANDHGAGVLAAAGLATAAPSERIGLGSACPPA